MLDKRLIEQLKRHEGVRAKPYRCPAGKLTVGYGHNLEVSPLAVPEGGITEAQAEQVLMDDALRVAKCCAAGIPCWFNLNEARQAVLINMGFNLGMAGLFKFKDMLKKLEAAAHGQGNFGEVGAEMADSRWYQQVKGRADDLLAQMVTGDWV